MRVGRMEEVFRVDHVVVVVEPAIAVHIARGNEHMVRIDLSHDNL